MLIVFVFEMSDFSELKEDSTDEENNSGTCKIVLFVSKVFLVYVDLIFSWKYNNILFYFWQMMKHKIIDLSRQMFNLVVVIGPVMTNKHPTCPFFKVDVV